MLGGDSTVLAYQPLMAIGDLKLFVQKRLGPVPEKQRILYKEQELKVGIRLLVLSVNRKNDTKLIPNTLCEKNFKAIQYITVCLWQAGFNTTRRFT